MQETEIPYKSLDGQPLETRLYALTQLYHAIERLDVLNDGAQALEDVEKTRRLIKKFVNDTMNATGKDADAGMKVLDDFPEMLEIADASQEDGIKTTKELLEQQRGRLLQPKADYRILAKGENENVAVATEKIISQIFNAELNKGAKNKKTPNVDTNSMAANLVANSWDNEEDLDKAIKTLRQIREKIKARLVADWQTYKKSSSTLLKPIEDDITGIIDDKLTIKYSENGNPEKIKNANKTVRSYFTKAASREEPCAKITFLKMMGVMMAAGQETLNSGTEGRNLLKYRAFKELLEAQYKNSGDVDTVINDALGITKQYANKEDLEAARREAFVEKSKEVYINAVAGLLTKKQEKEKGRITPDYIKNHVDPYIRYLREGSNNVLSLGIVDSTEKAGDWDKLSETKQKILEDKISTIHHKHPIASAITLYMTMNPEKFGDKKPNDLSEMELADVARDAQKYVNVMGNYCMPIGADVHESLEPHGLYSINKDKDNTILAARFNKANITDIIKHLNMPEAIKKNYIDALNKYSHNDSRGNSLVTMKLPDNKKVDEYRETLREGQKYSAVRGIANTVVQPAR